MLKLITGFMLTTAVASPAVWAADFSTNDDSSMSTSSTGASDLGSGYLRNEVVGIKPEVGVLAFKDQFGSNTSRGAVGLDIDYNVTKSFISGPTNFYIGPQTGLIYSHQGSLSSNFLGTNPDATVTDPGANVFIIPANLKVGYNFSDALRIAAHGGGNVVYRSIASSLNLGESSAQSGSAWKLFPNVGADVELGLAKNVALLLRPDWTISPQDTFFTGMLGLGVAIG